MSGMLESYKLCETLYDLIQDLAVHDKTELSDIVKYSYILSVQTFIESYESYDYGNCEEYEATEDTFCLDYFDWDSNF